MQTTLDTTNWVAYPFEVNGVKFNSLLNPKGDFYPRVERLPAGAFESMNKGAIANFIGDPSKLTNDELQTELNRVNEFATQALIVLA